MNSSQRNKAGLLSRVSTIAVLAATGTLMAAQQARAECVNPLPLTGAGPHVIAANATHPCVVATNVTGNVTNNGVVGDPGDGDIGFFVGDGGITGQLLNNGSIAGGGFNENAGTVLGALTIGGFDSYENGVDVAGGILNQGSISSSSGNGIQLGIDYVELGAAAAMTGLINNSGTIFATTGDGVAALVGSTTGGLFNDDDGLISGGNRGIYISGSFASWSGGIRNEGQIHGNASAIQIGAIGGGGAVDYLGGIANEFGGRINSTTGPTISVGGNEFLGGIRNDGEITQIGSQFGEGTYEGVGIAVFADSFIGGISNAGTIDGRAGPAIWITSQTELFRGGVTNQINGIIAGDDYGVLIDALDVEGDTLNRGSITGNVAFAIGTTGTTRFGATNAFASSFTNTGSIIGDTTGLDISVVSFKGNIVNGAGGLISGGVTGAEISAATFTGNITNNGTIRGFDSDTGLHIVTTGTHTGNIVNNGTLSAPGNALHVQVNTLVGNITNTGTIDSTANGTAVRLDIGNNATFINDGEIYGNLALGDVVFGGKASLTFRAQNGGIEGNINGLGYGGNNDSVIVEGTHYFVDGGGENGTARNLTAFTVNSGGTAVMGARSVGGIDHLGYGFSNVDALNVNAGGTLYIDKSATLNVGDAYNPYSQTAYAQQSNSTLMFYLGAPDDYEEEVDFSDRTGVIQAVAGIDYGQLVVNGTAHISGTLAGYLDPEFQNANPGLTSVVYNDVIIADDIEGSFTDVTLLANSSIWQLTHTVQGGINEIYSVDLFVSRNSLSHIGGLSNIVVETAGPWKSMVNDRSNGIGSGSCGLAGEGWCLNRFAANEQGATQVMTDATPGDDPFNWLRTGVRKVGETAAWGRAVGVWGETDGDHNTRGTDFRTAGFILGIDHVFTPTLLAGVATQWTTSDIDFDGRLDNAEVDSFEAGAYVSYGDARLYVNANASVIWHDFEVNRFAGAETSVGDYDGRTVSAYVEAGKIFETEDGLRIQPLVAVSFAHLETDAYSETGSAGATKLNVFDSEFESLKGNIGARLAYPIQMQSGRKWVPEARIVLAHEFMDDQSSFLATIQGGAPTPQLITGEEYSRDTIVVGAGVTVPLADDATLFVDYDAGLNHDVTSHTLSAGLRLKW